MIAEVLLQQIDSEVLLALSADGMERNKDYTIYRYVDDIFVFTSTQEYLEKIIEKYKMLGEKYLLQLNELKLAKGETPCVRKGWLEKTRHISDAIDQIFYTGKRADYDALPDEERFIVKSDYIPVDRIKSEITVIMKAYPENRRTIVSFLLSTLLNNISKRKDGYILFGDKKIRKAMLLLDMALFIYAFCPSFDQTRKVISFIVYMGDEIDFRNNTDATKRLKDVINRYVFIFQRGNIFDLCDWLPFFSEYNISLIVEAENALIEKAYVANDPVIWANILLYSKYYESFSIDIQAKICKVIESQISKISFNDVMLHKEFWYILIFHNCPHIPATLRVKMDAIVNALSIAATSSINNPSSIGIKLVCDYLQRQSPNGNKPTESFFNWNNVIGIGAQITYRTYQRTIFKQYRRSKHGLYASIE